MVETTWAEVNLDNIKLNYANIRKKVKKDVRICGVVKANAYGHGAIDVARVLEWEGIDYLAVARLEEAIELRKNGIIIPILCLGYVHKENYSVAVKNNIILTVYSYESAEMLNSVAKELGVICTIHIKIDTGMHRIGFLVNEESAKEIKRINSLDNLKIEGIYTHFSKADEYDKDYTNMQIKRFDEMYKMLKDENVDIEIRHVSNSAGTIDLDGLEYEMVRCGIVLYGHYPSNEVKKEKIELCPAMTLKTRISHIKKVKAGDQISYGGKYCVDTDSYIATLPIGYADGFFRGQITPQVVINGIAYDVVGRICMDQCMINLGDNSKGVSLDDEVIIFGPFEGVRVEDLAEDISTINYEVLCAVSRRVDRVYIEKGKILKRNYILD